MPVAELDGIEIAYELVGEGQPWVLTPGGRFTKEVGGLPEMARALADHGQAGADLGPSELRRVVGRVPRRVGVGGPGRGARRAPSPSRSRPHGDRRRLGRRAGVAARRAPATPTSPPGSRCGGSAAASRDCSSWPTTTACRRPTPRGTAGWKPSSSSTSGRRCWRRNPGNRERFLVDGPPGVPRRDGPLDAGLLPVRRLARPRARRRRRRPPRRPDPRVPQRHVRHVAHPRHLRGARPPACRAPSWSSRRGATTSGTSVEPRSSRRGRSSCAGRCSSRNSSTGPTGRSRPNVPERSRP